MNKNNDPQVGTPSLSPATPAPPATPPCAATLLFMRLARQHLAVRPLWCFVSPEGRRGWDVVAVSRAIKDGPHGEAYMAALPQIVADTRAAGWTATVTLHRGPRFEYRLELLYEDAFAQAAALEQP